MRAQPTPIVDLRLGFFDFFGFLEALLHEPAGPYPIVTGSLGFFVFFVFLEALLHAPGSENRRRDGDGYVSRPRHPMEQSIKKTKKTQEITKTNFGATMGWVQPTHGPHSCPEICFFSFFGFLTALLHELSGPPKKALEWVPGWGQQ